MEAVVIFNRIGDNVNITNAEMEQRWRAIYDIPELTKIRFESIPDSSFASYDAIVGDADILMGAWITKDNFRNALFERHPNLRYAATLSHGFEEFDFEFTRSRGVTITNTIYGDVTIAEFAAALLFDICHDVRFNSDWLKSADFSDPNTRYWGDTCTRQIELFGKTAGIIGLGNIGFHMAEICRGLGMKVISHTPHKKMGEKYGFVEQVELDELLRRADVISLHCPLNSATQRMIDRDAIAKMKDGVILINTARGALIDEKALNDALESRHVYAAGLDVLEHEPPKSDDMLLRSPYTKVTAHIAWVPRESRLRAVDLALENLKNWLHGSPTSVING